MTDEITIDEFLTELKKSGARAVLQVRHAERPRMDPTDPTFGDRLAITEEGVRTSRRLGEILKDFAGDVTFVSSPLLRTTMTAEAIAAGMGVGKPAIPTEPCLGNGSFYYKDIREVLHQFRPEHFFDACFEYFEKGDLPGFHNLHEATAKLESWLLSRLERRLLIATTHDCYIAAFMASKCGMAFTRENWTRFLDGGAIFVYPDGIRRYALVRTGLSTGIVGVGGKVM